MMNENLPNGIPNQHDSVKPSDRFVPFNGVGSSHSSRDSSPGSRLQQIPLSQLPPSKMEIPAGQLPPRMSNLTGQIGRMSLTKPNEQTPISSPKVITSTPILECKGPVESDLISPIVTSKPTQKENVFTHSSTSRFASVKTTDKEEKKVSAFFAGEGQNLFSHGLKNNGSLQNTMQQIDIKEFDLKNQDNTMNIFNNQRNIQQHQPGSLQNKQMVNMPSHVNLENDDARNQPPSQQNLTQFAVKTPQQNQQSSQHVQSNLRQNIENQNSTQPVSQQNQMNVKPATIQTNQQNANQNFNQLQGLHAQTQGLHPQNPSLHSQTQGFLPQQNQQINVHTPQPNVPRNQVNYPPQNVQQNQWSLQQPNYPVGFPQRSPVNMPILQPAKTFGGQTQSTHQPLIQPHLQHQVPPTPYHQAGQTIQQTRMPPPKSSSFPGTTQFNQNTNVTSPPVSDQNKAHLHTNRYPQRPSAPDQFQQNNSNQSQPSSIPNQQNTFPNQSSAYQNQSLSGYQAPSGAYQNQQSGYQNQPTTGYQNQSAAGYQNQPTSSYQNPPSTGFQPPSTTTGYQSQPTSLYQNQQQNFQNRSVTQSGFNKLWGNENFDLLQCPNILPQTKVDPPKINLGQEFLNAANCSSDIFRCTMTKIPESTALLQKSRLPLGVLIHPFKDLSNLPVIQCNTIVRCRTCRTYINPFVFFVDSKRWKCNLCYRVNELPEEFQYDPVSKTYGDPSRRPEVRSSTIEYIAPAEYMLRPPQPAIYLYLFDVSRLAVETGYLHAVCNVLSAEINNLPGDARTQIGFLCYDSCLHFYSLSEGQNQPHELTVLDIDDIFIPCPDNLLVNLQDRMDLITDLLSQLPSRFANTCDTGSALGAALQAAYKMTSPTGGRITVFQTVLPNKGPGGVVSREDPNQRSSSEIHHLNPANDFYKRLALECSGQQIAVDLFILNSQYVDLATISGISRFSGGCIYHFPLFKASRVIQNDGFERAVRRYVTRKIGFEAVMRIRCTRGLSIHTFHGNFFVRSTDLLSLPNINPDAGFGMQVSIEENLSDVQTICFQAALLYTSSKGERRIRVHTICLPVANTLHDIINSADQQCIIGLLAKMAVDRSMQSSLSDAREAFLNVAIDILTSYKLSLNMGTGASGLMAPTCLKLLPLYISALLKSIAFRVGTSTRLDDRVRAMCDMKTKPLPYLIQQIYPDLYPVHNLEQQSTVLNEEEEQIHLPPHLQLTARNLDSNGAYLMDMGDHMVLFVCANISQVSLKDIFDTHDFNSLSDDIYELPVLSNPNSRRMQMFINYLNDDKPYPATFQVIKENSPHRVVFLERLIEDRLENSLSYHEFLQHIKSQVK